MDINKYIGEKIKFFRNKRNITQEELAEKLGTTYQSISRYETGDRNTNNALLYKISQILDISINDLFPPVDNAEFVDIGFGDSIRIPVLGYIKAGLPIEAQEDIIDYIDIPKVWTKGGKEFYALKISGDSMTPKYQDGEIVIFEKTKDYEKCNKHDCAVMINCTECTFKKFTWNEDGVTLIPYNTNKYELMHFTREQVESMPISVIGLAVEKRTNLRSSEE